MNLQNSIRETRRRSLSLVGAIIAVAIFAEVPTSFGLSVRAREQSGTVQEIDLRARRLTIDVGQGIQPLVLVWDSSTWFVEGIDFTSVNRLQRGVQVTAYYHSPFFGDRYATKIVVQARLNDRHVPATGDPKRPKASFQPELKHLCTDCKGAVKS